MSLGSNIRKRRYELNLSQQELANLMGYRSRATIAKIESGENDVSHAKLRRFAQVLDTTFEALTAGTEHTVYESPAAPQPQAHSGHRTAAVILAGGKSVRNHQNVPNQFINIQGKPVVIYCLEAYQNHPAVDDIYIVCLRGWEDIMRAYAQQYHITKLREILPAGISGVESAKNAFSALRERYRDEDVIVLQESTRPMVTVDVISKLLQACAISGSATICQPMRDYVQFLMEDGKARYIDREALVDLQSPEAHTMARMAAVFDKAQRRNHLLEESCCAMLMHNLGESINFIEGSAYNLKIVRQEDVALAAALLRQRSL